MAAATSLEMALSLKYRGILASFYDADHAWRDYDRDAGLVDQACKSRFNKQRVHLLDLCCGTGSHTIRLAQKGYLVTGLDASRDMLRLARRKAAACELHMLTRFKEGDFSRPARAGKRFHGAYLLGLSVLLESVYDRLDRLGTALADCVVQGGFFMMDTFVGSNRAHSLAKETLKYRVEDTPGELNVREHQRIHGSVRIYQYRWKILRGGRQREIVAAERLKTISWKNLHAKLNAWLKTGYWTREPDSHNFNPLAGYHVILLNRTVKRPPSFS